MFRHSCTASQYGRYLDITESPLSQAALGSGFSQNRWAALAWTAFRTRSAGS